MEWESFQKWKLSHYHLIHIYIYDSDDLYYDFHDGLTDFEDAEDYYSSDRW